MGIAVPFSLKTILLLCLLNECKATALKAEPCDFKSQGMVKNVTFEPNPPRIAHFLKISGNLYATRDLKIIKVEGYAQDEETGFKLTFRELVCDLSETFCPVMKGEIRKMEYSLYLSPIWTTDAPITAVANLLDENGNFVASASTNHCSIVKK